jgi:VCBS repeat-containing protein
MKKNSRHRSARRAIVETLEPRILFSADFVPAVASDLQHDGGAEQRTLAPTGEFGHVTTQDAQSQRHELVIVDANTPDYQKLVDDITKQGSADRSIEVVVLEANKDGIAQITDILAQRQDLAAVHLISHGADGQVQLGSNVLDFDRPLKNSAHIKSWGKAFAAQGDLLIYGCDVAQHADGKALVEALARLTGADVAASENLTGAASQGGDWNLEYEVGNIETQVAVSAAEQAMWSGTLANSAPVLSGANNLPTIAEDAAANPGTLVSALIAGKVADSDPGALSGIAVTAVNNTNGTWQYSLNGGGSWNNFGTPTAAAARLLAADATTYVRFVPNANWNGTVAGGITFRAWDQTSGAVGGTAAVSASQTMLDTFSAVSYSNNDGTANWSGNWVENDPGGLGASGGSFSVNGGRLDLQANGNGRYIRRPADLAGASSTTLSFDYVNALGAGDTFRLQLYDGTTYTDFATFSTGSNAGSGTFSADISAYVASHPNFWVNFYLPSSGANGHLYVDNVRLAYTIDGGGSTAFSSASASSSINVTAVNDAPVNSVPPAQATSQNTPLVFSTAGGNRISVADVDAAAGSERVTLTGTNGTISLSAVAGLTFSAGTGTADSAMTFTGTVSAINAALDGLSFTPTTGFSGAASLGILTNDQGNTGAGGALTASDTVTIGVASAATPVAGNDAYSVNEDTTLTVKPSTTNLVNWWKLDDGGGSQSAVDSGSSNNPGTLGSTAGVDANDPAWTTGRVGSGALAFNGSGDYVTTTSTVAKTASSFTLSAWFKTNTTTGQQMLLWEGYGGGNGYGNPGNLASTSEMSLSVGTYNQNNNITFHMGYDVPANGGDPIYVVSSSAFTDTTRWHQATVTVSDSGGGVFSASLYVDGVLQGSDTGVQNDRSAWGALKIGSPGAASRHFDGQIDEVRVYDTALSAGQVQNLARAGVLQNDTDPAQSGLSALLVSGPANGTVNLNADGSFSYTPNANFAGTDTFTYRANDGTSNSNTATATITVNPVNDAPVGTNNTVVTNENTPYSFVAGDFGFSDVNDSPANSLMAVKITTLPGVGSLMLSGIGVSAGQSISVANINSGNLTFAPAANANGAGYASFTFQVQDDGGTANGGVDTDPSPRTMTVNVTPVNDAPVGTNNTVTANEDTAYTFVAGDFGFSDPNDSPANNLLAVKITTLPGAGSLTLSGGAVSAGQSISVANISAGNLKFAPANNANGNAYASFTFQVQDDGGTANGGVDTDATPRTMTVNVTPVNDAPVLAGANDLSAINEDPGSNPGTLVSALIAGQTSDVDAGALTGIAMIGVDNTNGTWQYSTNGGSTWIAFGSPSGTSARLLAADANTYVRFVPNANWNGTVSSGITFRAWDQSSGAAGGTANITSTGGTSAFSAAVASAGITVNAVNHAPIVVDQALLFDGVDDKVVINPSASLQMTTTVTMEAWVQRQGTPTGTQIILNKEGEYEVGINAAGHIQWAFANTTPGWTWIDTGYALPADQWTHIAVSYNAGVVNTYVNGALVDAYNGSGSIDDAYPALNELTIGGRQNAATQRFQGLIDEVRVWNVARTGAQILASYDQTLTGAEAGLMGYWRFNEPSGTTALDLTANGNNGTLGGGTSSNVPVRQLTYSLLEDGSLSVPASGVLANASDAEGSPLTAVLVTGPAHAASFSLNADGSFSYTPVANYEGSDSFVFRASDGWLLSRVATVALTVTSANDAPVGTNNTVTTSEDTPYVFGAADFGFSDPNDTPANSLLAVKITNLPGAGSLINNGAAVVAGQSITLADITGGKLQFAPALNANGAGYASFTFQVQDDGGTANGGADTDSTPRTMTIDVTPVNDAPAGANNTVITNEDTPYVFGAGDFGFSDPNDSPANTLAAVTITSLPTAGTLTNNGVAVSAGQSIIVADIASGRLQFAPALNANGAGYASFTFQVRDNGGTANGGVNLDPTPRTMTVDVTATNDAPVLVNNVITVAQGGSVVLAPAQFLATDTDTPAAALIFTASGVQAGRFELIATPGTALTTFTQADVNAGLVRFVQDGSAVAPAYQVSVSDGTTTIGPVAGSVGFTATPSLPSMGLDPSGNTDKQKQQDKAPALEILPAVLASSTQTPARPAAAPPPPMSPGRPEPAFADLAAQTVQMKPLDNRPPSKLVQPVLLLNNYEAPPPVDPMLLLFNYAPPTVDYQPSRPSDWGVAQAFEQNFQDHAQEQLQLMLDSVKFGGMALSVGVVWWASRVSAMLGSLLASAPAWRNIDPLPVLGEDEEEKDRWLEPDNRDADANELAVALVLEGGRAKA